LDEVVGSALRICEARLAGRKISVDLPPDLPMVKIDAVSMEQVLVNIFDNAVQYTPPGSPLDVIGRASEKKVSLEIADRGPGIPSGKEKQVFEKFFRSHPTAGQRGIGLGLAICRGIVEAHGGTITALHRPGGGAIFRIELSSEGAPVAVHSEA
jgi:two-component system sensor histidine kinase KdpD